MIKVCVVTGGRMDYGHLYKVMKEIDASSLFELQIIATCMHLSPEFGLTFQRIKDDGFKINKKVECLLSSILLQQSQKCWNCMYIICRCLHGFKSRFNNINGR